MADSQRDYNKLSKDELIERINSLEVELRQSEGDRKAFLEASTDGYWDWRIQDSYEYMSPRFWEIFGFDYKTKTHDPAEWQDLIFQEDLNTALKNFDKHCATKGKHPYAQEVRYKHADGSTVTVLCRGKVVEWGENSQPIRMIGTHTDITQLKIIQEELKASLGQNALALKGMSVGTWDWDIPTGSFRLSPKLKSLIGIPLSEAPFTVDDFLEKLHPMDIELVNTELEKHFKSREPYDVEYRIRHTNGEYIWVRVCGHAVWNAEGRAIRMAGSLDDITEFKNMHQRKEELANAMKMAIEGISKLDPDGCYIYVNKAYAESLGYNRDELLGKHWSMTVSQGSLKEMEINYKNMLEWGVVSAETTGRKKDGTSTYKQITMIADYDETGTFTGHYCFSQDINDRKKFEAEKSKLILELTKSNEELDKFAYICSHDLQEPLRMIESFSGKLEGRIAHVLETDEKCAKYFDFIKEGASRAQDLINDILAYVKIQKDAIKSEQLDLNEILQVIEKQTLSHFDDDNCTISYSNLPRIIANKTQVYQLFQNIINNAVKYRKPNIAPVISVTAEDKISHWQFTIADNGIGIEKRHLNKVFEIFQRLHRRGEYNGSGIGLSICKTIVERHGGNIWVTSEKDKGSSFHFTLQKHT